MDEDRLNADRQKLEALLAHTTRTFDQSVILLQRQRATVEWFEQRRYPASLARELHAEMVKVVETLRWQKAWIEHQLRRTAHLTLRAQPHPWDEVPPPDLLSRICVELDRIVREDATITDPEATDRAVDAAIARAVGQR